MAGIKTPVTSTPKGSVPPVPAPEEGVEELEDDAIIAQETEAHAPQRRQKVRMDEESVVISEPAPPVGQPNVDSARPASSHPAPPRRRRSAEPTLVIRDRRRMDELRAAVAFAHKRRRARRRLYLWGMTGAVTLLVVSLFVIAKRRADEANAAKQSAAQDAPKLPRGNNAQTVRKQAGANRGQATRDDSADAVSLEELPVESR